MGVGEGEKQDRAEGEVELQSSYAKSPQQVPRGARTALQSCLELSNCPGPFHLHTNKSSDTGRGREVAPFGGGPSLGRSEPGVGRQRAALPGPGRACLGPERGVWGQCASTMQRERVGEVKKVPLRLACTVTETAGSQDESKCAASVLCKCRHFRRTVPRPRCRGRTSSKNGKFSFWHQNSLDSKTRLKLM